jgi:hypothetical protein
MCIKFRLLLYIRGSTAGIFHKSAEGCLLFMWLWEPGQTDAVWDLG